MSTKNIIITSLTIALSYSLFSNQILAQNLKVSENNRFLVKEDGDPFFWLGDTAWELFHRLDKKETEHYLRNRSDKGFNVVQCVLPGLMGLQFPNRGGDLLFDNMDPSKPNEKYLKHVDWVIDKANELGLNLAILPIWGRQIEIEHPGLENQKVFDEVKAYNFGVYLGSRYKDHANIVWVLGGDATPEGSEKLWDSLAKGIKAGGSKHLMTYHI